MSASESIQTETAKGSVKLTMNAKGEIQPEIKSYIGDSDSDMIDARERAIFNLEQTVLHFSTTGLKIAGTR